MVSQGISKGSAVTSINLSFGAMMRGSAGPSKQNLDNVLDQVRCDVPTAKHLEFCLDGAFFLKEILELLDERRVGYAIKVPFWNWLDLKDKISTQRR